MQSHNKKLNIWEYRTNQHINNMWAAFAANHLKLENENINFSRADSVNLSVLTNNDSATIFDTSITLVKNAAADLDACVLYLAKDLPTAINKISTIYTSAIIAVGSLESRDIYFVNDGQFIKRNGDLCKFSFNLTLDYQSFMILPKNSSWLRIPKEIKTKKLINELIILAQKTLI